MKKLVKLTLAAVLPALFIAACGGGDDSLDDRADLADPKLRLVHAVPGAPNVSLFRNDAAQASAVTDVAYKSASQYFDIDSGNATWAVRTTTTPPLDVGSVEFEPSRGTKYTLIAVPDAGSLTEVVRISDPYNKGLVTDKARLRVFHAAFNAGEVDVYLTAPDADITDATPTIPALAFKEAAPGTGSDSLEVEGGAYRIRITAAGTKDMVFNAAVTLDDNADWLVTAIPGSETPNDVRLLVVKADEGVPATEVVTE